MAMGWGGGEPRPGPSSGPKLPAVLSPAVENGLVCCFMKTLVVTQFLFGAFLSPNQMHNGREGHLLLFPFGALQRVKKHTAKGRGKGISGTRFHCWGGAVHCLFRPQSPIFSKPLLDHSSGHLPLSSKPADFPPRIYSKLLP